MTAAMYHLSKDTEGSLGERVELFLICRQTQPHVDSDLNWHLSPLGVHRILSEQKSNSFQSKRKVAYWHTLHCLNTFKKMVCVLPQCGPQACSLNVE